MPIKSLMLTTGKALYPIGEGGGESVAHDLLTGLCELDIDSSAMGVVRLGEIPRLNHILKKIGVELEIKVRNKSLYTLNNRRVDFPKEIICRYRTEYPVSLSVEDTFLNSLSQELTEKSPDVVLIQAEMSGSIFELALKKRFFPVAYLHREMDIKYYREPEKLPLIISNSIFTHDRLKKEYNLKSEILLPPVNLDNYIIGDNSRRYITMINPVPVKGVGVFLELVSKMPEREFLAVEGWGTPSRIIDIMKRFSNIRYLPKQHDIRDVLSNTDILIVPSQWEEPFGRVIIEAGINGIPAVASRVGGIPEALGKGGVLVDDYADSESWLKCISRLERNYEEYSNFAKENAKRFSHTRLVKNFLDCLDRAHAA